MMGPEGARLALAMLDVHTTEEAAALLGRSERMVRHYLDPNGSGPPPHVELALAMMVRGELAKSPRAVRYFLARTRTRRDGARYEDHRPSETAAAP